MSKKGGGKGILKRFFSKDDNPEASSSAAGTVTEKKDKKKKVRIEVIAFSFDLLTFSHFTERIGKWPRSPCSRFQCEANSFSIRSNVPRIPRFACFQYGGPWLRTK